MIWNPFKSKKPKISDVEYITRFRKLWKDLVPPMYESKTLQGELIRCIGNLDDESKRNGNMNWDEADEEAVEFLRSNLCNSDIFEEKEKRTISDSLSKVLRAGQSSDEDWLSADDELDYLLRRVVDICESKNELIYLSDDDEYIGHS